MRSLGFEGASALAGLINASQGGAKILPEKRCFFPTLYTAGVVCLLSTVLSWRTLYQDLSSERGADFFFLYGGNAFFPP